MRGLEPRIHSFQQAGTLDSTRTTIMASADEQAWVAGSSPAMARVRSEGGFAGCWAAVR